MFVVTSNQGKLKEIRSVFPQVESLALDLPEIQSLSLEEVVRAKLDVASEHGAFPCLVDDTGLYFGALGGFPGPFMKFMLEAMGRDAIAEALRKLGDRSAYVETMLGLARAPGDFHFFRGWAEGEIVPPRGEGFGWDAIFEESSTGKTFGELTSEEKLSVSSRGKALQELKSFLR